MKVFKRTAIAFFAGLVLVACKRENYSQDAMTLQVNTDSANLTEILPLKAYLSSTPNVTSDSISFLFPDSFVFATLYKFSTLTGNTSQFGKLDKSKSQLIVRECSLDIKTQTIDFILDMTLRNKNGEGLKFLGSVNLNIEGITSGVFEVIEGYGKYRGFTGWIATEGFLNTEFGTIFLSLNGMITQPNKRFRNYFAEMSNNAPDP